MNQMEPDYSSQYGFYSSFNNYQAADPSTLNNFPGHHPGHPDAWPQSSMSPTMHGDVYNMAQIQQYPPYLETVSNHHHHGQLYDRRFHVASPGLQSQDPNLHVLDNFAAAAHHNYHPDVPPHYSSPGSYTNHSPDEGQWNSYLPFVQHGTLEPGPAPSTTSPSITRQLATNAVSDAAEKRRVNPHRFFCQYCDRGFTARHNYTRHLAAHNDERPFDCECGSAFTTKSDLKRHQFKSKKHGNGRSHATEHSQ